MVRQRITFLHKEGEAIGTSSLRVTDTTLVGPEFEAAREERLTVALDELPAELKDVLLDCHELHVRWISPYSYESLSPVWSRAPPGLHVFYTPRNESSVSRTDLCNILRKSFGSGVDCHTPEDSFTSLPHDRFSHSTAYQYYSPLDGLAEVTQYTISTICRAVGGPDCSARAASLTGARSLDLSYDTISHALRVTAFWPIRRRVLDIKGPKGHRTEVGILGPDSPPTLEPQDLGLSGLLTVLGNDKKASPTAFSFPSRHRHADSSFSASYLQPTGLHPVLQLSTSSSKPPVEDAYCSAHAYLTLPRTIFADKYQLGDELFLQSKNLTALRYTSAPVDLEAPDYALKRWGSALLLELAPPESSADGQARSADAAWTAEIPLHLRYLAPAAGGYEDIELPYPVVFWACAAEEGTKFPTNPFDRVNLGYDGLFGPRTVFWHVDPAVKTGARLLNEIKVPVLDLEKTKYVNVGTGVCILLGFLWVVYKLVMSFIARARSEEVKAVKEKKQQ